MVEKYYEAWNIDLYMLAVAKFSDDDRIPHSLRDAVDEMMRAWDVEIEARMSRVGKRRSPPNARNSKARLTSRNR